MLVEHGDLARRLEVLEQRYDGQFKVVSDAIRALMTPPKRSPGGLAFAATAGLEPRLLTRGEIRCQARIGQDRVNGKTRPARR